MEFTHHPRDLSIDPRFSGLPGLAQGGYVGGLLSAALGEAGAEVKLRRPVPTSSPLTLGPAGAARMQLRDGETLLAEATAAALTLDVPPAADHEEARAASERFPGFSVHPYPGCFACGTEREHGDGLRVFPGSVEGRELVAAPWTPPHEPGSAAGSTPPELVWAMFDCLELWALILHAPGAPGERVVTSALTTVVSGPVVPGEPHVAIAWPLGREGDRLFVGAALIDAEGRTRAVGRQTAVTAKWGVPLDLVRGEPAPVV